MRRGTTPTLTIEALNVDLTSFQNMVLIRQGSYLIKRKKVVAEYAEDVSTLSVTLTQKETLALKSGKLAYVQVRFINEDGVAGGTEEAEVPVKDILEDVVIEYEL